MHGDERPKDRETRREFLRLSLVPALGAAAPSLFASDAQGVAFDATDTKETEGAPEMGITRHKTQDIGVAKQINAYSDAVEVKPNLRWLYTSGTPALTEAGELPPDITGQAELAWKHTLRMLDNAGMSVEDLVKVTQYLTRPEDIPAYVAVRKRIVGDARPAYMLLVVPQLIRPGILLEIEVVAAKE